MATIGPGKSVLRRVRATGMVATLAAVGLLVTGVGPAEALVAVVAGPSFPATATVGDTFPASLAVSNFSTPPESQEFPVIALSQINLVPSCDNTNQDCAGGIEVGVFALSATGVGNGSASCSGPWTITEISPGLFRFTPPGGEGSAQVASGESCVVDFTATALRLPDVDPSPGQPGVQTNQVLSVTPGTPTVSFAARPGLIRPLSSAARRLRNR